MSQNADQVRQIYERFSRGDFTYFADFGDDFEFVTSPEQPDAGTYRGEEARQWATAWVESFDDLTMEATEIIDADVKVIVGIVQRGQIKGSQTPIEGRWWNVLTFRDGELIRSELYPEREAAIAAAGLSDA